MSIQESMKGKAAGGGNSAAAAARGLAQERRDTAAVATVREEAERLIRAHEEARPDSAV